MQQEGYESPEYLVRVHRAPEYDQPMEGDLAYYPKPRSARSRYSPVDDPRYMSRDDRRYRYRADPRDDYRYNQNDMYNMDDRDSYIEDAPYGGGGGDEQQGIGFTGQPLTSKAQLYQLVTIVIGNVIIGILLFIMPLVCIVMGSLYISQCPLSVIIPVYLILFGICSALNSFCIVFRCCLMSSVAGEQGKGCFFMMSFFSAIMLLLFIVGCVTIYSSYGSINFLKEVYNEPSGEDEENGEKEEKEEAETEAPEEAKEEEGVMPANYCHPSCFYFAFWLQNTLSLLLVIGIIMTVFLYARYK